ncbi:MFS transporter [Arthrobacter sp. AK01]|uniref:MFS transporter n=1 Tax=Arthrobacter sp. AK01 TaxID=2894084 RepID=UPI001E443FC6|nr:MFS transporter [Arthrobacter sp. AK01]MCD4850608.1 MFS transporter [Arthrobacter sp. AK01]
MKVKLMTADASIAHDKQSHDPGDNGARSAHWGGIFALSFGAFALVASEFLPISLLTPIAADLKVSEGAVGLGIAISGAFAVLTSLSISNLTRGMNRKTLLIGLAALMGISGAVIGFAPGYLPFMVGRAFIGVVIGGFWSMSAATAIRLVPASHVPHALAIVNGGNALATVIAAPLGSYLGSIMGWRGAFLCLVPVAALCLIWLWLSLPSLGMPHRSTKTDGALSIFNTLRIRVVAWGLTACGAFFLGQFILFTYLRPFLERVTLVDESTVSLVLLILGVTGLAGTVLIGRVLGRWLYRTLVVIPSLMALVAAALSLFGGSLVAVLVLLSLWGLLSTSAPVGWWSWIANAMPQNAEQGGGLMVAVIQTCIALGSTLGGLIFDSIGYQSTFLASGAMLVLAAITAGVTARVSRRATA